MWQQPRATESSKLQETESIGQLSALAGFCRAAEGMDWEFSGDGSWCWGDSGSSGQECFGHQTLIGGWLYCQLAFRQTFSHNLLRIPSSFHMVSKVDNRRSGEPLLSQYLTNGIASLTHHALCRNKSPHSTIKEKQSIFASLGIPESVSFQVKFLFLQHSSFYLQNFCFFEVCPELFLDF